MSKKTSIDIRYIVTGFTAEGKPMTSPSLDEYPTVDEIEDAMKANRLVMLEVKRVYFREPEEGSPILTPDKQIILPKEVQ